VVEVEVGGRDEVDVVGTTIDLVEGVEDRAVFEGEDLSALGVHLVPGADFEEDALAPAFEEEAVVLDGDSAFVVDRDGPGPDDAGDQAEHGAAVEAEVGGAEEAP
jgi:hypothetical protein